MSFKIRRNERKTKEDKKLCECDEEELNEKGCDINGPLMSSFPHQKKVATPLELSSELFQGRI